LMSIYKKEGEYRDPAGSASPYKFG